MSFINYNHDSFKKKSHEEKCKYFVDYEYAVKY